jgi:hypothetical protein
MSDTESEARWHWAEGIKFALEGVKLLFILNGAASVSILTFIGHMRSGSGFLVGSLIAFAIGAASVIPAMVFAYLTQLHYGNAAHSTPYSVSTWRSAVRFHYWAYAFMGLGLLCFLIGSGLAAFGLWHVTSAGLCPVQ